MDFLKSIFDAWDERIRSPILGSILFIYLACNWRALFFLFFADDTAAERLAYFDSHTSLWSTLIFPLVGGLVLAWLAPWVKFGGAWVAKKANLALAKLQEGEASDKRKRQYEKEAQELEAKTGRDVAIVESQGRIRAAEERLQIQDEQVLQEAAQVSLETKEEIETSRGRKNNAIADSLSPMARKLLIAAVNDKSGIIMQRSYIGGTAFSVGGEEIMHDGTRRGLAEVEAAIEELVRQSLVRSRGSKGEIFEVTKLGFEVAEALGQ
ncbi:hypothetical protein [Celeribacter baekdonensis]|uniref:Uncharacterized protein n=1 Tax=Celeribacter baekdonensis TaxID=875171 RepID=A0A2R4M7P8_9RHOB|nr:hypothetical protein [Celeribacter baekdonensis]AVW93213.1 hypothetical protein DA792_20775 [Celeribacter baekdonensis]